MPRLIFAHRAVTRAIADHDRTAAALWMKRHLQDWRRGFEHLGHDVDRPLDRVDLQAALSRAFDTRALGDAS